MGWGGVPFGSAKKSKIVEEVGVVDGRRCVEEGVREVVLQK